MLRFRLFDVQVDEVRLLVNWQDVGPLAAGPVRKWSEMRSVTIPASLLLPKGRNVIGFVARGEFPTWQRWGVRDVSIAVP